MTQVRRVYRVHREMLVSKAIPEQEVLQELMVQTEQKVIQATKESKESKE